MRSFVLAPLVALLLCSFSSAQEPMPWANKLFGGELSHDFGAVKHGVVLKHTFKITNIYKVPLEITDIRFSCDCVKAEASTRSLAPTKSATLTVTMDARKFAGPRTVKIMVTVGPKFTSTAVVTVAANVRGDAVLTPSEIDFGDVSRGQAPTKTLDLEYLGNFKNWKVTEINVPIGSPFQLKVDHLPADGRGARKGYRLIATVKTDAPAGAFKREVILKTNDPANSIYSFSVLGTVRSGLSLSPDAVVFKAIKVGETQSRKVFVRASRPIQIVSVDGQADGISVDIPKGKDVAQVITVTLRPTMAGEMRRQLTIRTDLETLTAVLPLEANVKN